MKRILLVTIVLALSAGVAAADRGRHNGHWKHRHGDRHGAIVVSGPRVYSAPRIYSAPRVYSGPRVYHTRRPIYVQRPAIRYRYYNYYQRPAVIVENYPARAGYYWVAGQWTWSGAEWIWQPGHYEPDQSYNYQYDYNAGASVDVNYQSPGYDYNYSSGYQHDCN